MLDALWVQSQTIDDDSLSDPYETYKKYSKVLGFGPYRSKSALLFWGNQLGHATRKTLMDMPIVPMASGPRAGMARITGFLVKDLYRPIVATIILRDVSRALESAWKGRNRIGTSVSSKGLSVPTFSRVSPRAPEGSQLFPRLRFLRTGWWFPKFTQVFLISQKFSKLSQIFPIFPKVSQGSFYFARAVGIPSFP